MARTDPRCPTCGEVGRRGVAFKRSGPRFYFRGLRVHGWLPGSHHYESKRWRRGGPTEVQLAAYCPDPYHERLADDRAVDDYRRANAAPENRWRVRPWKQQ